MAFDDDLLELARDHAQRFVAAAAQTVTDDPAIVGERTDRWDYLSGGSRKAPYDPWHTRMEGRLAGLGERFDGTGPTGGPVFVGDHRGDRCQIVADKHRVNIGVSLPRWKGASLILLDWTVGERSDDVDFRLRAAKDVVAATRRTVNHDKRVPLTAANERWASNLMGRAWRSR